METFTNDFIHSSTLVRRPLDRFRPEQGSRLRPGQNDERVLLRDKGRRQLDVGPRKRGLLGVQLLEPALLQRLLHSSQTEHQDGRSY